MVSEAVLRDYCKVFPRCHVHAWSNHVSAAQLVIDYVILQFYVGSAADVVGSGYQDGWTRGSKFRTDRSGASRPVIRDAGHRGITRPYAICTPVKSARSTG